jgi:PAS domain S-box-containing protein
MTIKRKLISGFLAVAILAGVVGLFGLSASRQIVRSFDGGEEHFRSIVSAATAVTSYAKRAEGHLLLYLTLDSEEEGQKFYQRYESMRNEIAILDNEINVPEARQILENIKSIENRILKNGVQLIRVHDRDLRESKKFRPESYTVEFRRFHDAAGNVVKEAIRLARLETNFLNKQQSITSASELASYVKEGESHLMLFLDLGNPLDRERYFKNYARMQEEVAVLSEVLKNPESIRNLDAIKATEGTFYHLGTLLLAAREDAVAKNVPFREMVQAALLKDFNEASSRIRKASIRISDLEAGLENNLKEEALARAGFLRLNILLVMSGAVIAAILIGYFISKAITDPISKLKTAVSAVGKGHLWTKIDVDREDELGILATCFNQMSEDLTKSLVSREYVENILKSMMDALIVLSPEMGITRVNQAATRLLGCREEDLIGRPFSEIVEEIECQSLETDLLRQGFVSNAEINFQSRSGDLIPVLLSGSVMRNEEGRIEGIVCAGRDISERKRVEAEKERLQTQLIQAQKMETVGTLAGGIAHDFNNLLTPILGFAEIGRNEVPPESTLAAYLDRILEGGTRARDLVQQILTFSRHAEPHRQAVRIDLIVDEAARFLRASLPAHIEIRRFSSGGPWTIFGDASQIHQVVMNLGTNAYQAMEETGGILELGLEAFRTDAEWLREHPEMGKGEYVALTVRDDGQGMDPMVAKRIFEPFFTTKEVGRGTGLGLSVVHGIVRDHGGSISVSSEPGRGAEFRVLFPRCQESVDKSISRLRLEPASGQSVLFVDDEESVVLLGTQILEGFGYRVTTVTSSDRALDVFRESPEIFDVVVTDLMLPGMKGCRLAEELRHIRPDLPIVLLTGNVGAISRLAEPNCGIEEILGKPFAAADLDRAVRRALAIAAET